MNSKKTFTNQELFAFVFKDEEFADKNQFKIGLPKEYKETITKKMLDAESGHDLELNDFAAFQLDIDVGINFFYFTFVKVWSDKDRTAFLDYQYSVCDPEKRLTLLYRIETFASVNYWYNYGEYSRYEPKVKKVVLEWVMEKYTGVSNKKSKMSLLR